MTDSDEINDMIEECQQYLDGYALDFIDSLKEFYERNGFITEKQEIALRKFYSNIRF